MENKMEITQFDNNSTINKHTANWPTGNASSAQAHAPAAPPELGLLLAVLNQVDYGMAVVQADTGQLVYANRLAQSALHPASTQPTGLTVANGRVCARQSGHDQELAHALARSKARLRGLLSLVGGASETTVAVVPLDIPMDMPWDAQASHTTAATAPSSSSIISSNPPQPQYAMLVFAKQRLCDTTSITLFAHEKGLTGAEGQVLARVCEGMRPQQIAVRQGVQISTVRTQLRSIRQKTASDSVRELVDMVSVLPPLARHMQQYFEPQRAVGAAFG